MVDRRKLLKCLGILSGLAVLPLGNLLANNGPVREHGSSDEPVPILVRPGEGEKANTESTYYTRKIMKQHTGGAFSSVETVLKNGYLGAPPHLHQHIDELMYVIDGTVTVMAGTDVVEVEAGAWHFRPRKAMHCFWNTCGKDALFMDMFLPGGLDDYLYELGDVYKKFGSIVPGEVDKFVNNYDIETHFELLEPLIKKYNLKF